jgi:hypothetical protein
MISEWKGTAVAHFRIRLEGLRKTNKNFNDKPKPAHSVYESEVLPTQLQHCVPQGRKSAGNFLRTAPPI